MKKVLVILNAFYPFARQEDFLANEVNYICGFDEIVIAPNSINAPIPEPIYKLIPNVKYLVNQRPHRKSIVKLLFQMLFMRCFYQELTVLFRRRILSYTTLRHLVSFFLYALDSYNTVRKAIATHYSDKEVYLYSYWMHASAFVACLLKNEFPVVKKAITRCHRFDLYEYRSPKNYIPMRNYIYENIDEIHSISDDGIKYLTQRVPKLKDKLVLSRLGTKTLTFTPHKKNKPLKIVSCSWIRPVKRIDLILEALAECKFQIEWTHFGDGEGFEELAKQAQSLNNPNVAIHLPGAKSNKEVIKEYYNNNFDVFINVSSSEGIPVSIMEAMSMGMIIVATAVGGTPEIVDASNGFLLDKDFTTTTLADILSKINDMNEDEYADMSNASRMRWEESYMADKNYRQFFNTLIQ